MKGYTTTVTYTSKEISKKESIRLKDLTDAISLDAATEGGESLQIKPVLWAVVAVHNESSREKDYNKYVIEDAEASPSGLPSKTLSRKWTVLTKSGPSPSIRGPARTTQVKVS